MEVFVEGCIGREDYAWQSWWRKKRDKAAWRGCAYEGVEQLLSSLCGGFGGWTDDVLSMFGLAWLNALQKPCFPLQGNLQ